LKKKLITNRKKEKKQYFFYIQHFISDLKPSAHVVLWVTACVTWITTMHFCFNYIIKIFIES